MMTPPAAVIIDIAFLPVYLALIAGSCFGGIRFGFGRQAGFIFLILFCALRLGGNVMLVYEYYQHYTNQTITTWGYILQGLGYSFLNSAALAFAATAYGKQVDGGGVIGDFSKRKPILLRLLHLVNIGGLVLLIIGYTDSSSIFTSASSQPINLKAKTGNLLLGGVTLALFIFCLAIYVRSSRAKACRHILIRALIAMVPFMAIRTLYGIWRTFQSDFISAGGLWLRFALEYLPEVGAVLVLLTVRRVRGDEELVAHCSPLSMGSITP